MIRSLVLSNFKCYESQEFSFKPLTVISGLNSTGKSTLVQALLLLRQSNREGILSDGRGLSLNGELVELGTGADVFFESAGGDRAGISVVTDESSMRMDLDYDLRSRSLRLHSCITDGDFWKHTLFGDAFQYLRAERLGPRSSGVMSEFGVRERRQLGANGQFTAHFLSEYRAEEMGHHDLDLGTATARSLLAHVEAWLAEISPGVRLNFDVMDRVDLVRMTVSYATAQAVPSEEYRPTNVGFGISYALPIVVALLSTAQGGLVILENPEAHVHPRGQTRLGEMIARAAASGIQVIVETHSDHLLNGVRLAVAEKKISSTDVQLLYNRWTLGSNSPSVREIHVKPDGRLSEWPDGFFDEFERSLDALIQHQD